MSKFNKYRALPNWHYSSRLDHPGASKPQSPHYDHNLHSLQARTSALDRRSLTPDTRFQKGIWILGFRP
jgi:hypothetical protein